MDPSVPEVRVSSSEPRPSVSVPPEGTQKSASPLRSLRATGWMVTLDGSTGSQSGDQVEVRLEGIDLGHPACQPPRPGTPPDPDIDGARSRGTKSSSLANSGSKNRNCQAMAGTTILTGTWPITLEPKPTSVSSLTIPVSHPSVDRIPSPV